MLSCHVWLTLSRSMVLCMLRLVEEGLHISCHLKQPCWQNRLGTAGAFGQYRPQTLEDGWEELCSTLMQSWLINASRSNGFWLNHAGMPLTITWKSYLLGIVDFLGNLNGHYIRVEAGQKDRNNNGPKEEKPSLHVGSGCISYSSVIVIEHRDGKQPREGFIFAYYSTRDTVHHGRKDTAAGVWGFWKQRDYIPSTHGNQRWGGGKASEHPPPRLHLLKIP